MRAIIPAIVVFGAVLVEATPAARPVTIASPGRDITLTISVDDAGPRWRATLGGRAVIEPSALGIVVDGVDLARGATLLASKAYRVDERYPARGVHAEAVNRANGARLSFGRKSGRSVSFIVDVRVFDDGVAFRYEVPGSETRVPDAATIFTFPAGTIVWAHGLGDHYEGVHARRAIEDMKEGEWAAPPMTVKLAGAAGYASVTEADLRDYAGMALQADGANGFHERLAHTHPVGYPFTLRYGEAEAKRLTQPAAVEGPIRTPWRVVMMVRDLNGLVTSDIITNLCPSADPKLFPQGLKTPWLRGGRAVWRYLDGGENTFEGIKEFSRLAGELGFEHQVVEGLWQKWEPAQLRELVEYSRARGVSVWVWRHRNTLGDPVKRRELFASLRDAGVAGVKVDFFDHEAREVIDLYRAILRDAAEYQLMVDFHGANKPTGEWRTWPNEMTREGIYGLEHRRMEQWATFDTTWPFTRLVAGPADFTPVVFGDRRRETSWAHQIASAAILTSPLLVYGAHPASLLDNPAVEIIKAIPSEWDETIVLAPSEIGELALFGRRKGTTWFVAAMNGPVERTTGVSLAFLGRGRYDALIARDRSDTAAAVDVVRETVSGGDTLRIPMRAAGGFIARLTAAGRPSGQP